MCLDSVKRKRCRAAALVEQDDATLLFAKHGDLSDIGRATLAAASADHS